MIGLLSLVGLSLLAFAFIEGGVAAWWQGEGSEGGEDAQGDAKFKERDYDRVRSAHIVSLAMSTQLGGLTNYMRREKMDSGSEIAAFLSKLRAEDRLSPEQFEEVAWSIISGCRNAEEAWQVAVEFLDDKARGMKASNILCRISKDSEQLPWMERAYAEESGVEARIEFARYVLLSKLHARDMEGAGTWLGSLTPREMDSAARLARTVLDGYSPDEFGEYISHIPQIEDASARARAAQNLARVVSAWETSPSEKLDFSFQNIGMNEGAVNLLVIGAGNEKERYQFIEALEVLDTSLDLTNAYYALGSRQGQRESFEAVLEMAEVVPAEQKHVFLSNALKQRYSEERYEKYMNYAESLPNGEERESFVKTLADAVISRDLEKASSLAATLPPSEWRESYLARIESDKESRRQARDD